MAESSAGTSSTAGRRWRKFLVPRFITAEWGKLRQLGPKGYLKKRGPWFFALIVTFYLVRDSTLYIIIPYLIINGLIDCPGPAPS